MPTSAQIASSICTTLALTEPDLDTSIGSVARKIIDAVAASTSDAFTDRHLTTYQYDIDSMSAGSLDTFVRLFGMDRLQARFAVGVVTFTRTALLATKGVCLIPGGTQVKALTDPTQYVQTMSSVVMSLNQTTIDVPVQVMTSGVEGNISAGLLTAVVSAIPGLSAATTNVDPLVGGANAESDEDLRARWKATVFRNLAGTTQMFVAMALGMNTSMGTGAPSVDTSGANSSVSRVNVLGPRKTWLDRISIVGGVSPAISYGDPAYIYSSGIFLGTDIANVKFLSQGSQFTATINNAVQPATITFHAVAGVPDTDGVTQTGYDIQYDYVPAYSRNDPFGVRYGGGFINNRVDIWTNGCNVIPVTQTCVISTSAALQFTANAASDLCNTKYTKLDGTHPAVGDIFMPLAYGPVVWVPSPLHIGTINYALGTHYDIVNRSDAFGSGPNSQSGLVWHASGGPADGSSFSLNDYQYNQIPTLIQQSLESAWRLMGTDVMVHAGFSTLYRFHLGVVYSRGFNSVAVQNAITAALQASINSLGFDSSLQISDVLQTVHNVPGVDNVRFLTSADDPDHYAIEPMLPNSQIHVFTPFVSGVVSTTGIPMTPNPSYPITLISQIGGRAKDLYFDDAHYPVFHSTRIITLTRTTFGAS